MATHEEPPYKVELNTQTTEAYEAYSRQLASGFKAYVQALALQEHVLQTNPIGCQLLELLEAVQADPRFPQPDTVWDRLHGIKHQ